MRRKCLVLLTAVIIFGADLARADDRNLLPKYGSLPKTKQQEAADAKFIAAIDEQYNGDRNKASMDLALRGWQYLAGHHLDDAMRRFNQAWLLNKGNGTALWGMAAIQADAGKLDESVKLFAEAEKSVGGQLNFSVDYARALGKAGADLHNDAMLKDAFERFKSIYEKMPANTLNLQNWAMTLFAIGRYSEAWEKVKLAEATPNGGALDPRFLAALQARMPRPEK